MYDRAGGWQTAAPASHRGGYRNTQCVYCLCTMWTSEEPSDEVPNVCKACDAAELKPNTRCGICLEERARPIAKLPCSLPQKSNGMKPHIFCEPCLGKYITTTVGEGSSDLCCPEHGCGNTLGARFMKHLLLRGYVDEATLHRLKELRAAEAKQHLAFILSGVDPLLTTWALENAQSCPGCFTVVEKGEGCAHMTCKCGAEVRAPAVAMSRILWL